VGETVRLNESSPNTKERSTRRVRASRTNQQRKSIEINSDDLITHHWSEQLVFALLSWALGYVGSFFIWLGLAIRYPIFAEWLYTLLVFEIVGSALFALLAALREELLRKIAKQGFVFTFFLEKGIFWAYYGAFLIALYPLLSLKGRNPRNFALTSCLFIASNNLSRIIFLLDHSSIRTFPATLGNQGIQALHSSVFSGVGNRNPSILLVAFWNARSRARIAKIGAFSQTGCAVPRGKLLSFQRKSIA